MNWLVYVGVGLVFAAILIDREFMAKARAELKFYSLAENKRAIVLLALLIICITWPLILMKRTMKLLKGGVQ